MTILNPPTENSISKGKVLDTVVNQGEEIKTAVEECADEISTVNSVLEDELESQPTQQGVENALLKSKAVELRVQDCAEDLSNMNQSLKKEVQERASLENELLVVKESAELARNEALHDPLTSLPNRLLFNDRLHHGLTQATRHDWMLAVMFIDLDNFKNINDTYGHAAGDIVLKTVATRLINIMRSDDTLSRHGGDEFLHLLLELKNEKAAGIIAEKIIRTIGEPCIIHINNTVISYCIQLSIGIALFPKDGDNASALIHSADKAMYRAKKNKLGYAFCS